MGNNHSNFEGKFKQNSSKLKGQAMHLAFIGDSTLDNVVWIKKNQKSIRTIIKKGFPKAKITNLAADGFTTQNVLDGGVPLISQSKREQEQDPFPVGPGSAFHPLQELHKIQDVSHIILSVGGNDIRTILNQLSSNQFLKERIANILKNYKLILEQLLTVKNAKIVIMLQYRVSVEQNNFKIYEYMDKIPGAGTGLNKLNNLLEQIYSDGGILSLAEEHNIPVIDLVHSFDIYDSSLYECQIEPSERGGKLIADIIMHVINNHDFSGPPVIYQKNQDGTIETQKLDQENNKWKV